MCNITAQKGVKVAFNNDKCYFCRGINNGKYLRKRRICLDCERKFKAFQINTRKKEN